VIVLNHFIYELHNPRLRAIETRGPATMELSTGIDAEDRRQIAAGLSKLLTDSINRKS
jgi:hypothetical protein